MRGLWAKHPRVWLGAALGLAFLLATAGALFAGISAGTTRAGAVVASPTPSATPVRPAPSALPPATRLRTCSVAAAAADPHLGTLAAHVVNTSTGEVLFDRDGATPHTTASVLKLLTAAAAVNVLGVGAQLSTRVMDGVTPGTIVLVGGGDPTLATTPGSFYVGAPLVSDLAAAAMTRYSTLHPGVPVTDVVLDASMWDANDSWDPSWDESERAAGYQPFITALMVDGDRADPTASESPRGDDPIARAGRAFADAASLGPVTFSRGTAAGGTVLAEVKSQPVGTLIGQMLLTSDNTLAEMLARVVSVTAGKHGTSGSLATVIPATLKGLGLADADRITVRDGSGESELNAVPTTFVTELLVKIAAREHDLGVIYDGMPVGGQTGDLYDRFSGPNASAAGAVVAKPGWGDTQRSLAGIVHAADGTTLAFAFYGMGDAISFNTRRALDTLTTGVFSCGDNLSNN